MASELAGGVDALAGIEWTAPPDGQIDFLNQRPPEYAGLGPDDSRGPRVANCAGRRGHAVGFRFSLTPECQVGPAIKMVRIERRHLFAFSGSELKQISKSTSAWD